MINSYGYPCETHQVLTRDGYILTLHRIPSQIEHNKKAGRTKESNRHKGTPVLLGHSVVGSSAIWAFAPDHSLAYKLADEGILQNLTLLIDIQA